MQHSNARDQQWRGSFQDMLGAPPGPNSPPHHQRSGPQFDRDTYRPRPNRQYDDFKQRPERNMHDSNLPGRVYDDNSRPVSTLCALVHLGFTVLSLYMSVCLWCAAPVSQGQAFAD